MNKVTVMLLTTVLSENLQLCWCESIPESKDLFHKMSNKLQTVINTMSRRNNNLLQSKKLRLLLTMQKDLKKLTVKNLKTSKDIENAVKSFDTETVETLSDLNEVIKELLKDQHEVSSNSSSNNNREGIDTENVASIASNDTSVDTLQFSKHILDAMDIVKLEYVTNTPIKSKYKYNDTSLAEFRKSRRKNTYNLKLWRPKVSSNNITRRIYNGKRADIREYPFIVSIHVLQEFMCAGSIISKDLVITCASCLFKAYHNNFKKTGAITVRAGSDYTNRGGELLIVTNFYFHSAFDPAHNTNNLVIARIQTGFRFSNSRSRIRRVEYEQNGSTLSKGVTMMGWGVKDSGFIADDEPLSSIDLNVYKLQSCKDIYYRNHLTSKNFCAGFHDKGGGACKRDVGGPGVVGGVLVGVVSFGPPLCGTPGAPTVFTKIGSYVKWINSVVKKSILRTMNVTDHTNNSYDIPKVLPDNETSTQDNPDDIITQIPENETTTEHNAYDNSTQIPENETSTTINQHDFYGTPIQTTENKMSTIENQTNTTLSDEYNYKDHDQNKIMQLNTSEVTPVTEPNDKVDKNGTNQSKTNKVTLPAEYYDADYKTITETTEKAGVGYYNEEYNKFLLNDYEIVNTDGTKPPENRKTPTTLSTMTPSNDSKSLVGLLDTRKTTTLTVAYQTKNPLDDIFLTRLEHVEQVFVDALENKNSKFKMERSNYKQTMLIEYDYESTTKTMKKDTTMNSIVKKDVNLSDNSDNYEEEDISQGLSIEYKVTQLYNTKPRTTKKSNAFTNEHKETDRDETIEIINGGLSNETIFLPDNSKKISTRKFKNRFRQIKSDLRARKRKKQSKVTSAVQTNQGNDYSHNSEDDVVLISRTMPKYDDFDDDLDQEYDEENDQYDTRRSILDYININK